MKKYRKLALWLVLAFVVFAVSLAGCGSGSGETPAAPGAAELAAEEHEKKEVVTVRASVPDDWVKYGGAVRLWAWKEGGEDVFEAWPGEEMIPDDSGWFTTTVPGWVDHVIVNGYDGDAAGMIHHFADRFVPVGQPHRVDPQIDDAPVKNLLAADKFFVEFHVCAFFRQHTYS